MQEGREVSFQTGKVNYNGQSGILCKFVTVTQGDKKDFYYILNDRKLDNGCYIVSTDLKEAIDPTVPRTHIGLIDKDANIIIPCENKTIKQVEGDYLLVERSIPQSQSVKEAIASRNDPAAATRMVSAIASIKDKLNEAMNHSGKFVMNDLLSEGTICTLDGKNLLNNQYFSFIGITNDSFCCSTNVPSDAVVKVARNGAFLGDAVSEDVQNASIVPPLVQPDVVAAKEEVREEVVPTVESPKPTVDAAPLDVSAVSVPKETIDSALNSDTVTTETKDTDNLEAEEETTQQVVPVEEKQESVVPEAVVPTVDSSENVAASTEAIPTVNLEPVSASAPASNTEEAVEDTSKVEETSPVESSSSESPVTDSQSPEEMDDIVHRVGQLVQDNVQLKAENEKLTAENEKLTAQIQESIAKLNSLSQDEEKIRGLEEKNRRLEKENQAHIETEERYSTWFQQLNQALNVDTSKGADIIDFDSRSNEDVAVRRKAA